MLQAKPASRGSCGTSSSFQPALELLVVNDTGLLPHWASAGQNHKIRNTANVKPDCELRIGFGIGLQNDGTTRHVRRRAVHLGCSHATWTAQRCPKIHQHGDARLVDNFVEQRGIHVERPCERRQRRLALAAAATVSKMFCRDSVLLSTNVAGADHGHGSLLRSIFAHCNHDCAAHAFVVSTTRKRALPLIMRSYASDARSRGNTSVIGLTPVSALNCMVSCESIELPEGQPITERRPPINNPAGTCNGSAGAPSTTSFPSTPKPSINDVIASPLIAVASTTLAPPSFISSAAAL